MNLVQSAMRRPLTIVVAVIAVALGSALALRQMPRDIFPTLGIPTIYVAQPYGGMDPAQMEGMPNVGKMSRRSEEHTSELQSHLNLVCRLLLEKKKTLNYIPGRC